jgi:intein/homing endonuclease
MLKASEDFKSKNERCVPDWIKYGSYEIKTAFLRGFFDADGSYCLNRAKYDYRVRFGQVEKQIIRDIKDMLESLGFKTGKLLGPYEYKEDAKPYYEVQVHGRDQVKDFNEIVKPSHPDKQLNSIIAW